MTSPTAPTLPPSPVEQPPVAPLPAAPHGHEVLGIDLPHADRGVVPDTDDLDRLPILDEIPALGALLEDLRQVDRTIAAAIRTLRLFEDTGAVEAVTGVDIDQWLAIVARRTHSDVRMLHLAVDPK